MRKRFVCYAFLLAFSIPLDGLHTESGCSLGSWGRLSFREQDAAAGSLAIALGQEQAATRTPSLLPNGGFEESILLSATGTVQTSSRPAERPVGWEELSAGADKPCASDTHPSSLWEVDSEVKHAGNASLHVVPENTPLVLASEPVEIGPELSSVTATVFVKGSGEVSASLFWMVDNCLLRKDWLTRSEEDRQGQGKDRWVELVAENILPPIGAKKVRMALISRASRSDFAIYYLKNAGASNVASILDKVFSGPGNPRRRPLIVADDRLNAVIVYSPYRSETRKAVKIVKQIDMIDPWDPEPCSEQTEVEETITELSGRGQDIWWDDAEILGVRQ